MSKATSLCVGAVLVMSTMACAEDEGGILSHVSNEEVCEGTVEYGERWMTAVGARLGISPERILPTTYYWLDPEDVIDQCPTLGRGCTREVDGEILIFNSKILNKHELVHALHLSAWPRRRPLLQEGLAVVFDDDDPHSFPGPDDFPAEFSLNFDVDEQLEKDDAQPETYIVGSRIVYWIVQRHGIDAFRDFWYADSRDGSAEEFRTLFEQHFGETLDAMLSEVSGQPACPLLTCAEDVIEWQGDLWTTKSPGSCDDDLTRGTQDPDSELIRTVLLEVPESGTYTVSVSEGHSDLTVQGVQIHPCGGPCPNAATHGSFFAGMTADAVWEAGLYRVTTFKTDATDPGVRVEIRPK